jgi:hypothetical protein
MIYLIFTSKENTPNDVEQEAIACFKVISDQANLTRSDAAKFFQQFDGIGYIHVGGRHVSINRDNCRVAMITSNHPDWN